MADSEERWYAYRGIGLMQIISVLFVAGWIVYFLWEVLLHLAVYALEPILVTTALIGLILWLVPRQVLGLSRGLNWKQAFIAALCVVLGYFVSMTIVRFISPMPANPLDGKWIPLWGRLSLLRKEFLLAWPPQLVEMIRRWAYASEGRWLVILFGGDDWRGAITWEIPGVLVSGGLLWWRLRDHFKGTKRFFQYMHACLLAGGLILLVGWIAMWIDVKAVSYLFGNDMFAGHWF